MLRFIVIGAAVLTLAACQHKMEETPADMIADGRDIAQTQCSSCHAVGLTGASPLKEAPPFRELGLRYHFPVLEEELNEGVHVGHPPMPNFQFTPRGTDALLAYLRHLQALDREGATDDEDQAP